MRSLAKGALTAVAAVCLCVSATMAFAQVDTGTILGTVKDGSGAVVSGAKVNATVLAHGRGDKVKIFKLRRRKHYQRTQGHRQSFTEVRVDDIVQG